MSYMHNGISDTIPWLITVINHTQFTAKKNNNNRRLKINENSVQEYIRSPDD